MYHDQLYSEILLLGQKKFQWRFYIVKQVMENLIYILPYVLSIKAKKKKNNKGSEFFLLRISLNAWNEGMDLIYELKNPTLNIWKCHMGWAKDTCPFDFICKQSKNRNMWDDFIWLVANEALTSVQYNIQQMIV